jgi:hypothetical protein
LKIEIELSKSQIDEIVMGILGAGFDEFYWWEKIKYSKGTGWDT